MSDLHLNEERKMRKMHVTVKSLSTILQSFQFEPEHKKMCGNESHEKEAKPIHASSPDLLHIRIGSLN